MTSQISDLYTQKPVATRLVPVAGLIGGALAIGAAAVWLWSRGRGA